MRSFVAAVSALAFGCSHPADRAHVVLPVPVKLDPIVAAPQPVARTLTIIGTNDLHGALERLPIFGGFVANVRAARAADGGGVLLVDAGDLFQGTLESNIAEGADIVRAYNQLGYAASAIGNHEFDYGPEGPAVTAKSPDEDPRGALKARIREAAFPFLVANIVDDKSGARIAWPNLPASIIVEVAGTKVGIVGASTAQTPYTTMPANFNGLRMAPAAAAIASEAQALRAKGAQVIVVAAHIGSSCKDTEHPADASSCDHGEELFNVLDALPRGLVDVFVAGHTHAAVAHRIDDIAVIESYSSGRAFGRVDVQLTGTRISGIAIHRPELMCPLDKDQNPIAVVDCHPAPYEGKPVTPDPAIQRIVDDALVRAGQRRAEKLGVKLSASVTRSYTSESAEGNLFTDLMLAATPHAEIALTNGGGLRADLPAGELTYGQLFEAMPFDNRFAMVDVRGKDVRRLVSSNLQHGGGILSWGGLAVKARCKDGRLSADIKVAGKPLVDAKKYTLATSDFLASGGDGLLGRLKLPEGSIKTTDVIIRDAIADILRKNQGTLDPAKLFGPGHKRLDYEGNRPVDCRSKPTDPPAEPD